MGMNLGALAGGYTAGLELGQRMRSQSERDQRDREEAQRRKTDWENKQEDRQREQGAWEELNNEIMRRTQATQANPSTGAPVGVPTGQVAGGQATTTPVVDQGAGLPRREIAPNDATMSAGLERPIDTTRPKLQNTDGTFSTEQTIGIEVDGKHYNIPTIINGQRVSPDEAIAAWRSGNNPEVGVYGSRDQADAAAKVRSTRIGETRGSEGSQRVGFGIYQNPNLLRDPEFLNSAAQIFIKAKMPEGVKWLERGYRAQQENAVDALKALNAGDVERAVQTFNAAGRTKVEAATPITEGPDKGKWQVTFQGGQSRVIDPAQELKSYLDPKAYFELANKERDDARAQARDTATAEHQRGMLGVAQQNARTNEQFRQDTAEINRQRARSYDESVRNRGTGKPMNEKDYNSLSAKVESQLRRHMHDTAPSDPTGKKQNNPLSEFVPDIREDVMRDVKAGVDPEVAFNNRYTEWADKFDKADQVLGQAFDKARQAGSGWLSGRKESVASLRASLSELEAQGVSIEEARRFAQASKRDMGLFSEAAQGLSRGQITPAGPPGLERRAAAPSQSPVSGNGERVPSGVPQGSRRIGTSGGKPVWQAPNGKKYIED